MRRCAAATAAPHPAAAAAECMHNIGGGPIMPPDKYSHRVKQNSMTINSTACIETTYKRELEYGGDVQWCIFTKIHLIQNVSL